MIDEEVVDAIQEFKHIAGNDQGLKQLSDFYEEMKKAGIAQNQRYSLPAVDTIGASTPRQRFFR
jgi:hypothetical protein